MKTADEILKEVYFKNNSHWLKKEQLEYHWEFGTANVNSNDAREAMKLYANQFVDEAIIIVSGGGSRHTGLLTEVLTEEEELELLKTKII